MGHNDKSFPWNSENHPPTDLTNLDFELQSERKLNPELKIPSKDRAVKRHTYGLKKDFSWTILTRTKPPPPQETTAW